MKIPERIQNQEYLKISPLFSAIRSKANAERKEDVTRKKEWMKAKNVLFGMEITILKINSVINIPEKPIKRIFLHLFLLLNSKK